MSTSRLKRPPQQTASTSDSLTRATRGRLNRAPSTAPHDTVSEAFETAAHQLRYEAVLEAVSHMGTDVRLERGDGLATARRGVAFAKVYALPTGRVSVRLAVDPAVNEQLTPCTDDDCEGALTAQFELGTSEPIRGWQLGLLRQAYRSVGS